TAGALALGDRGDQLALAHPRGAGDAERGSQAVQLRQDHRMKPRARRPTSSGTSRRLLRLGGGVSVAQWSPSLDGPRIAPAVGELRAGRPAVPATLGSRESADSRVAERVRALSPAAIHEDAVVGAAARAGVPRETGRHAPRRSRALGGCRTSKRSQRLLPGATG